MHLLGEKSWINLEEISHRLSADNLKITHWKLKKCMAWVKKTSFLGEKYSSSLTAMSKIMQCQRLSQKGIEHFFKNVKITQGEDEVKIKLCEEKIYWANLNYYVNDV